MRRARWKRKNVRRVGLRQRRPPAAGGGRLAVPRGSQGRKRAVLGESFGPGKLGIHPASLFAAAGEWSMKVAAWVNATVSTTARGARSEAERAEREAGQMRPCNPTTWAPSATGRQQQESQKSIACPKASPNRSRHRYADPRCARRVTAPERVQAAFSFGPCTARFLFRKSEKKTGGASRLDKPPAGAESPWPPDGGPNFHGRFVTSLTRSRGGHTIGPPRAVAPTGARNGFTPARRCAPADNPW